MVTPHLTGEEPWKTFATAADHPPDATVRERAHADADRAPAEPRPEAPLSIPTLPYLPVAQQGAPSAELADVDLETVGVLGEGGMGRVLLARQRSLRREVAVKIVKPGIARGENLDTL